MPTIQVSDRTKQMIERFVAEGRAADEAAWVEMAVQLYAEETEEYADDTAYVIEQARRGIADIEAGRFTTIACKADEDALWERIRARSASMVKDMQTAREKNVEATRDAAVAIAGK